MPFTMRAAQFGEMRIVKQQWKNAGVEQEEGKGFEPLSLGRGTHSQCGPASRIRLPSVFAEIARSSLMERRSIAYGNAG